MFKKLLLSAKKLADKRYLHTIEIVSFCLVAVIVLSAFSFTFESVTVNDGAEQYKLVTACNDEKQILDRLGIKYGEDDVLKVTDTAGGMTIDLERSYSLLVSSPDKYAQAGETTETYGDSTITDGEYDVRYEFETVTEVIKYGYKTVKSDKLDQGKTEVTEGTDGQKRVVYCKKYVGGKLVEKTAEQEEILVEAVDGVKTVGTKYFKVENKNPNSTNQAVYNSNGVKCISSLVPDSPIELDANGVPVNYTKVIEGKGSAYSTGSVCSTGLPTRTGHVAVNPKQIPYGTKMYIVSSDGKYVYGYAIAADTGGFATNGSGRIVDLFMNTRTECRTFGVRNVKIYILE